MSGRLQAKISIYILAYIRERGLSRGQHLSEQVLADLFRVSRAPVHSALEVLEKSGVVRRERNRGFFLEKGAEDLDGTEQDLFPDEAEDEPYLALASDRLDGKLPERVMENELIRRYRMTRPQIVNIMTRIAQEGWAERLPGHGWAFTSILTSREAYEQGYRFRAAIESAALLEPDFRVDETVLGELRAEQRTLLDGGMRSLPRARLFTLNAGFHERIMEWSGNPFFIDGLRRVNQVRRLIEYRLAVDRSRLERQCREHLEILDMIEDGDLVSASAYLRVHIGTACRIKAVGLA